MSPEQERDRLTVEEIAGLLREIRERVRARHPDSGAANGGDPLPDLMPLVHARDAAEAKVAAIGSVNPRAGGPVNTLIQAAKKMVARGLNWHVREQVEFNRGVMVCIELILEHLNDFKAAALEMRDARAHWVQWRLDWERRLHHNESQFLRSVAELQGAFQHRASLMEANFRDLVRSQHQDFDTARARDALEIQRRLWADLEKIRAEFEKLIHTELRLIRQRAAMPQPQPSGAPAMAPAPEISFDYARFAERFRGSPEYVKQRLRFYLPWFSQAGEVLDAGCGRGEFLELMREAGVRARGIDLSTEDVALCRQKGLEAEAADLFGYLQAQPEESLGGIFCAQVVEHLPPERIVEAIRLMASRLDRGGVLAIETPDPRCLAIFATHFYLDPTHRRPVPHPLLAFYMEEYGMGAIEVHRLSPAIDSMPSLGSLPEDFREAFFGGLDYAIIGRKLV